MCCSWGHNQVAMRSVIQDRLFWCKHILYIPTWWILFRSLHLIKYTMFLDGLVLGGHSDIWYFSSWKCNFIRLYKMYSLDIYLTHKIYFVPENSWPSWAKRVAQHVGAVRYKSFKMSSGSHKLSRVRWIGTRFIEDCKKGRMRVAPSASCGNGNYLPMDKMIQA